MNDSLQQRWEILRTESKGRGLYLLEPVMHANSVILSEAAYSSASFHVEDRMIAGVPMYEQHEIDLIAEMRNNAKSISLVLVASRVMRRLMSHASEEESTDSSRTAMIEELCSPLSIAPVGSKFSREIKKLETSSKLMKYLLEKIGVSVDENACYQLLSRLVCNVTTITDGEALPLATGLFPLMSAINHSCVPNATQSFDGATVSIVSSRPIFAHEEVCISYIDSSKATWCRRLHLMRSYHFYCRCDRCSVKDSLDGFRCGCDTDRLRRTTEALCYPTDDSFSVWSYIEGGDAQEEEEEVIDCFEDLCLPCGDAFLPLISGSPLLCRWFICADGQEGVGAIAEDHTYDRPLPSFVCSECAKPRDSIHIILSTIRRIFHLWRDYNSNISRCSLNTTAVVVILRHNENQVKLLEQILSLLQSMVSDLHYSIAQVTEKLSSILLVVCSSYEALTKLSPNNEKLRRDLQLHREKLSFYSTMMATALAACCPNYSQAAS